MDRTVEVYDCGYGQWEGWKFQSFKNNFLADRDV